MFRIIHRKLRRFCSKLRWKIRGRPKPKIIVRTIRKSRSYSMKPGQQQPSLPNASPLKVHIRLATFNAALFSMAPVFTHNQFIDFSNPNRPKSILKQLSPLYPDQHKSKLRVSINLPDNEISLRFSTGEYNKERSNSESIAVTKLSHSRSLTNYRSSSSSSSRSIVEVLRELKIDVLALQDVKAEEEKGMKPLSDLAAALGMNFVFAESWAPEYGNAILSKWKIKRSKVHKIFDDSDFRNVLKATIDVPCVGELNFQCTHLDHLDEKLRIKQINAIIQSNNDNDPYILAGGLNSLDETDYSTERWIHISKYYEEIGKPTPKTEVMRLMRGKRYLDAKDFSGECESVVMITKGQSVQGTCKYGTRVDYILASPDLPYKFVPGSYSVVSSKGTSDHHIVKVDIERLIEESNKKNESQETRKQRINDRDS